MTTQTGIYLGHLQQAEVPWRPGIPSVEILRAHMARGGFWVEFQKDRESDRLSLYRLLVYTAGQLNGILACGSTAPSVVRLCRGTDDDFYATYPVMALNEKNPRRPCMEDGTPLPWPAPLTSPVLTNMTNSDGGDHA